MSARRQHARARAASAGAGNGGDTDADAGARAGEPASDAGVPAGRGERLLHALAEQRGGPQLLAAARAHPDLALVGGAVRDLLLARQPRELDAVLDAHPRRLADELAAALREDGARAVTSRLHGRFGTAVVECEHARIDLARRRAESYAFPGALPDVRAGSAAEDLARRDFTVNALAVALGGAPAGELTGAAHALEDLDARRLRVLHERSFLDDPTRLLRLARYRARLRFELEPHTAALAGAALHAGALRTVSGARLGAELRLALREPDALAALAAMDELGVLAALHPRLRLDGALARAALALLPRDGRADLLLLASLLLAPARADAREDDAAHAAAARLLDALEFTAAERDRALRSAFAARALAGALAGALRASRLRETLLGHPLEAVALAGALAGADTAAGARARDWLERVRGVRLRIDGQDLLAAGIQPGPEIGRRLERALERRLDGELAEGREAELEAALEAEASPPR